MNINEFSEGFDVLVDSYKRFKAFDSQEINDSLEFNEYEKSLFLTKAQTEVVVNLYNGKNIYGDAFESTEEIRRYLDSLVKTKECEHAESGTPVSNKSSFFELPSDVAFITLEQVEYGEDPGLDKCYWGKTIKVYPVTQDEYNIVKDNPFRGPTKYKVLRADYGNNIVEIISKYDVSKYRVRYLAKPSPIVLEKLPNGLTVEGDEGPSECTLNSILHHTILDRAVALAVASRSIGASQDKTDKT